MKKHLTFIIALSSIWASANSDNNLPLNTEIEDIFPVMSQYLESKLDGNKNYELIKHRVTGNVYSNGIKEPNKVKSVASKSDILNEINDQLSYMGDTQFTKCTTRKTNFSIIITCTEYRPRYKQVRMEGQPYEGVGDAIFDLSNSLYNAFTSDTRVGDKIIITLNKRTEEISSVKIVF